MRWDRLFAELEAQLEDADLLERDALVDELVDGDWAGTPWRDLVSGHVVLHVRGVGLLEGTATLATEHIIGLEAGAGEVVVATAAVLEVRTDDRRQADPGRVAAALGWPHVLRHAAAEGDEVVLHRTDGSSLAGQVDVVGRDFVRLRTGAGRPVIVPLRALATLRTR